MFSRFTLVQQSELRSFLWPSHTALNGGHNLFCLSSHLLVDTWSGPHLLAILNKAAVNIDIQVPFQVLIGLAKKFIWDFPRWYRKIQTNFLANLILQSTEKMELLGHVEILC